MTRGVPCTCVITVPNNHRHEVTCYEVIMHDSMTCLTCYEDMLWQPSTWHAMRLHQRPRCCATTPSRDIQWTCTYQDVPCHDAPWYVCRSEICMFSFMSCPHQGRSRIVGRVGISGPFFEARLNNLYCEPQPFFNLFFQSQFYSEKWTEEKASYIRITAAILSW